MLRKCCMYLPILPITGYFLFLGPLCVKIPVDQQNCRLAPTTMAGSKSLKSSFFPTDAQFELQQLVFTVSTWLSSYLCGECVPYALTADIIIVVGVFFKFNITIFLGYTFSLYSECSKLEFNLFCQCQVLSGQKQSRRCCTFVICEGLEAKQTYYCLAEGAQEILHIFCFIYFLTHKSVTENITLLVYVCVCVLEV